MYNVVIQGIYTFWSIPDYRLHLYFCHSIHREKETKYPAKGAEEFSAERYEWLSIWLTKISFVRKIRSAKGKAGSSESQRNTPSRLCPHSRASRRARQQKDLKEGARLWCTTSATNSFPKMHPLVSRAARPAELCKNTFSPGLSIASAHRWYCLSAKKKAGPSSTPPGRMLLSQVCPVTDSHIHHSQLSTGRQSAPPVCC